MTLGKEASIAADSTISSSPAQAAGASLQIKRAMRTYGKRREEPLAEGTAWFAASENIHRTAPPGLKETIPPSSPEKVPMEGPHNIGKGEDFVEGGSQSEQMDFLPKWRSARRENRKEIGKFVSEEGDPDSQSEQGISSSRITFGVRKSLAEIDEAYLSDFASTPDKPKDTLSFGTAMLLQEASSGTIRPGSTSSCALTLPQSVSDDIFNGLPPALSRGVVPQSSSLSSPPVRSRRAKLRVVPGSDSEEEVQKCSSSTAPSTSGRNFFVSAKSPSSSTPPTSDDDVPSKIFLNPKPSCSGKPDSSRVSVPLLDFTKLSSKEGKRNSGSRQTKIKAPTKKELRETVKERSRLAAQTKVTVPRTEAPLKYTIENLFKNVSGQQSQSQTSDPIEPFTSPVTTASSPQELGLSKHISLSLPGRGKISRRLDNANDSEDDLPEITELLQEASKRRYAKELKELKQRALDQQHVAALLDGDDDLVISADPKTTVREEEENRRSRQSKQSVARKTVAQLAHVTAAAQARKASVISPSRIRKDFPAVIQEVTASGSIADLQRIVFVQAKDQASREIRRKEEEWTKYGGHLAHKPIVTAKSFECAVTAIAGKGLEIVRDGKSIRMEAESDNDEDEEWNPETRRSALPATNEDQNSDSESEENMLVDGDTTMVAEEQDTDNTDSENTKVHSSKRNLVLSDSEEDDKCDLGEAIFRRSSTSSGPATEDEHDKENNTRLMYDQGEDKENQRVVRHIFDVNDAAFSSPELPGRNVSLDDLNSIASRRPFQELLSAESPKAKLFASSQTFVSKLQQASPLASTLAPTPTLEPFFPEDSKFAGFSRFSQAEPEAFGLAPLQPGFSELFESGTERRHLSPNLAEVRFEERSNPCHSTKRKHLGTLNLTQDVAAVQLRPAFQAEESLVRKAEVIFEKEQAFVIEANTKKVTQQHTELYVNELGFLTQTKPMNGTPEVYRRVSPARGGVKSQTETPCQRMPLQTLSLSSPSQFESPRQESLRRLRRVTDTPLAASPPSVPPNRQLDAYELLRRGQQVRQRKEEKKRRRAELGILFEDEAAESDEDNAFGFVKKPADDEDDGEDLDQNLPGLVDDRKMDADTEAMGLVFDKYKEHLEDDDKRLEELHQAAVQGQLRQKRNRGIGIDDSDDDSEGDGDERARRAMKRARKSDRTDIKGLEANEETRAFADSYNQCLRDDDEDLAFLAKQHDVGDVVAGHSEARDEDNDGENEVSFDSTLQDRAREDRLDGDTTYLIDVSWLDQDDEMEEVPRVRSVTTRQEWTSRPDNLDLETVIPSQKSPARMNQTSKQWFNEESKTRNASTARKNCGLAVTGHRKREKVASKTHSSSRGPSSAPARQVKAAASALSIIADRSGNFA